MPLNSNRVGDRLLVHQAKSIAIDWPIHLMNNLQTNHVPKPCTFVHRLLCILKHPLFLIIDGMSQAYRAYFAIRGLASTQGLADERRVRLRHHAASVCSKSIHPTTSASHSTVRSATARHTQYDLYKATRKKMPSDLAQQMPYIRKFCEAMRIPVLEIPGQEADDIIATVATQAVAAACIRSS